MSQERKDPPVLPLPDAVCEVLARLNEHGYEAYAVGGCVRDLLRGVTPHDFDLTTSARPDEVHAVFEGRRMLDVGIKHGTVTLLAEDMPLEITTYRQDGDYRDSRHPSEVRYTASLREDAARRDFTVNAMAYHPQEGLIDFFGGVSDIEARCIRAVGDPCRRFEEDALRILRALRFAAVLGYRIEEHTARAARAAAPRLQKIAAERVREELSRLLCGKDAAAVLLTYAEVLAPVLPAWYAAFSRFAAKWGDAVAEMFSILASDPVLRYAAFFLPLVLEGDDGVAAVESMLDTLRFDRRTARRIVKLLSHWSDPCESTADAPRFLSGLGGEDALLLLALRRAYRTAVHDSTAVCAADAEAAVRALLKGKPVYTVADLAVRGGDLLACGFRAGRELGGVLETLLNAVLDGREKNEKEALLAYAKEHLLHKQGRL